MSKVIIVLLVTFLFMPACFAEKVVFAGDSLTYFGTWGDGINMGVPSDTSAGLLKRVKTIADGRPDKVYIMIGANDIAAKNIAWIMPNLREVIRYIKGHSFRTKIYIQSILPTNRPDIRNDDIIHINKQLAVFQEEFNITYIDLYAAFVKDGRLNPAYTTDGFLLSPEGYKLWKKRIGYQQPIAPGK